MKTGFLFFFFFFFFFTDHLLVGQSCTNPKSDRSLLSCLKVTQCSTSEIGDALLYNSCSLPIQVMTTGPLPAWFNTWGHSSMHRTTQTKEFIEKVQAIIDETPQRPIRQIARDLGISHTTMNVCVKEDLKSGSYRHQTTRSWPRRQRTSG